MNPEAEGDVLAGKGVSERGAVENREGGIEEERAKVGENLSGGEPLLGAEDDPSDAFELFGVPEVLQESEDSGRSFVDILKEEDPPSGVRFEGRTQGEAQKGEASRKSSSLKGGSLLDDRGVGKGNE